MDIKDSFKKAAAVSGLFVAKQIKWIVPSTFLLNKNTGTFVFEIVSIANPNFFLCYEVVPNIGLKRVGCSS